MQWGSILKRSPKAWITLTLYYDALGQEKKYFKLGEVVRKRLLLSHGQATVELSFSVNKDVSEHNLVAWHIVRDHIHHVVGLWGVVITKELLNSTQCGHQCYHATWEKGKLKKKRKIRVKRENLKRK